MRCSHCGHRFEAAGPSSGGVACPKCGARATPSPAPGQGGRPDPLIGQRLGEFEIVGLIGSGGMGGRVYKAWQASLDRFVALKVLPRDTAHGEQYAARFEREARNAAAVNHPNVVQIYSVGHADDYHYIAMELVDGESLKGVLDREGRLPEGRALEVMKKVVAGLIAAHEQGVLHRDLKPGNILLTASGRVKVADFGLAKRPGIDPTITVKGSTVGTPLYLPPEAGRGQPHDARSDLYSLGATFYHVLAGHPPFEGRTAHEIVAKHVREEPRPLRDLAPDADPRLASIIECLIQKNPGVRYPSASALLADLEALDQPVPTLPPVQPIAAGARTPGAAAPPPPLTRPAQPRPPHLAQAKPRRLWLIVLGLLAFIGLVALAIRLLGSPRSPSQKPGPQSATKTESPPEKDKPGPVIPPLPKTGPVTPLPKPKPATAGHGAPLPKPEPAKGPGVPPEPKVLFEETFANAAGVVPDGWWTFRGIWRAENGVCSVRMHQPYSPGFAYAPKAAWQDYAAECDIRVDWASAGLVVRHDGTGRCYALLLAVAESASPNEPIRSPQLRKIGPPVYSNMVRGDACDGPVLAAGQQFIRSLEYHHVRLEVLGNKLTAFVDGQAVLTAVDDKDPLPSGGVGFCATDAFFRSGIAYFKNLRVTSLGRQ